MPSRYPTVLAFKALRALRVLGACARACGGLERCAAAGWPGGTQAIPPVSSTGVLMTASSDLSRPRSNASSTHCGLLRGGGRRRSTRPTAARCRSWPGSPPQFAPAALSRLVTGLALAQELLVEELASRAGARFAAGGRRLPEAALRRPAARELRGRLPRRPASLIAFEALFRGTLTQTSVYPREVMRRALHHDARRVILAHNHPSGNPEPSLADEVLTRRCAPRWH